MQASYCYYVSVIFFNGSVVRGDAGITGKVSIDENGDRNADYSLLDLNPKTGKFQVGSHHITSHRGNGNRPLKASISEKYFLDNKC